MEVGEIIGYAKITPDGKLKALLDNPSFSILSDAPSYTSNDPADPFVQEFKEVDKRIYESITKALIKRGINLTPEEVIRENTKGLFKTFEIHELMFSDYLHPLPGSKRLLDEAGAMAHILHPISEYNPGLTVRTGELVLAPENIYSLSLCDRPLSAKLTQGTLRGNNKNELIYGQDIFPTTLPLATDRT